jgi:hypothetical protein
MFRPTPSMLSEKWGGGEGVYLVAANHLEGTPLKKATVPEVRQLPLYAPILVGLFGKVEEESSTNQHHIFRMMANNKRPSGKIFIFKFILILFITS